MNTLLATIFWLSLIIVSSYILAEGADRLAIKIGRKFTGRIILGIATTLPEIAIVFAASAKGLFDIGIGATFGSNILMMSLGLAIMVLVATTRLSLRPAKEIDVGSFKLDFFYLLFTAVIAVITFMDGYDMLDFFIFLFLYLFYSYQSYKESNIEREEMEKEAELTRKKILLNSILVLLGSIGIFFSAGPFAENLKKYSIEINVPAIILALVIAPIGGEMPEKLSLIFLARKGGKSVEISIGNIFGSKILNNTLLISAFILGGLFYGHSKIPSDPLSFFLVSLAGLVTAISMLTFVDRKLNAKDGIVLAILYVIVIYLQYLITELRIFS